MDPNRVNCPGCGKSVAVRTFCNLCGERLDSLRCAQCGTIMNAGSRVCGQCGAAAGSSPLDAAAGTSTPILVAQAHPSASGAWLKRDTMAAAIASFQPIAHASGALSSAESGQDSGSWADAYLGSPNATSTPASAERVTSSIAKPLARAVGTLLLLVFGLWAFLFGGGMMIHRQPGRTDLVGLLVLIVLSIFLIGGAIWAKRQSGWRWFAAVLLFGPIGLAIHAYRSAKTDIDPRPRPFPAVTVALALCILGAVLVGGSLTGADSATRSKAAGHGDRIAIPGVTTFEVVDNAPPLSADPPAAVQAKAPETAAAGARTSRASFEPESIAELLLNEPVLRKENPGSEPPAIALLEDPRSSTHASVTQTYDEGVITYVLFESDVDARKSVESMPSGSDSSLAEFPGYPTARLQSDGLTCFYVVVGNVMIFGSTSDELLEGAGFDPTEGDAEAVSAELAGFGVQRLLRVAGVEPDTDRRETQNG